MKNKDYGGLAFPAELRNEGGETIIGHHGETIAPGNFSNYGGMTLRDYFAAKAMQSILSLGDDYDFEGKAAIDELPRHAYAMADAMLAERAK